MSKANEAANQVERLVSCNMERYGKGLCGKSAKWKHPRWSTGIYCDGHKNTLEQFFPDGWEVCG